MKEKARAIEVANAAKKQALLDAQKAQQDAAKVMADHEAMRKLFEEEMIERGRAAPVPEESLGVNAQPQATSP